MRVKENLAEVNKEVATIYPYALPIKVQSPASEFRYRGFRKWDKKFGNQRTALARKAIRTEAKGV